MTPSASCSKRTSSVANRISAPSSRARSARIGSARSWLQLAHPAEEIADRSGPIASTSTSCSTGPLADRATMILKLGSGGDASTILWSTPASRNASIVCGNCPRALGCIDIPACRSTTTAFTPCSPKNIAVDNPAKPAPTTNMTTSQ